MDRTAFDFIGHCTVCDEQIIEATLLSTETCPRCGACPVKLDEDQGRERVVVGT